MNRPPADAARQAVPRHLLAALFDFEALPGRYPLTLREPRALFERSRDVLQLAAGRPVEGLALAPADAQRAQRAAGFFVRTALLRAGADHYTLLGLQPGCPPEALRDHYRLLMRLTHPDFAAGKGAWPPDAAMRINQAHDVLASPVRRVAYDRTLASTQPRALPTSSLAAVLPRPARASVRRRPLAWRWALGMVAVGGLGALALMQGPAGTEGVPYGFAFEGSRTVRTEPFDRLRTGSVEGLAPQVQQVQQVQLLPVAEPVVVAAQAAVMAAPAGTAPDAVAALPVRRAVPAQTLQTLQTSQATQAPRLRQPEGAAASPLVQPALVLLASPPSSPAPAVPAAPVVPPATPPAVLAVAPAAAAPPVPMRPPVPVPVSEPAARLSLADAQPVLGQMLQAMQGGRGEDVLSGLDRAVRQSEGAAGFVQAYHHLVGESRAIRLGPVQLRGRPDADQLVVDGVVQLLLHDQGQPPPVRELRWQAQFARRGGQVVMTGLSAGGGRP